MAWRSQAAMGMTPMKRRSCCTCELTCRLCEYRPERKRQDSQTFGQIFVQPVPLLGRGGEGENELRAEAHLRQSMC